MGKTAAAAAKKKRRPGERPTPPHRISSLTAPGWWSAGVRFAAEAGGAPPVQRSSSGVTKASIGARLAKRRSSRTATVTVSSALAASGKAGPAKVLTPRVYQQPSLSARSRRF